MQCPICDGNFDRKEELRHLILVLHEGKPFKCPDCDSKFSLKQSMNGHIDSVYNGKKPLRFKGSKCDPSFSQKKKDMKRQIASVHEGKKPFKCTICYSKFTRNDSLYKQFHKYIWIRTNLSLPICEFRFSSKTYVNRHIASVHERKKPFKCSIVTQTFPRNNT